jgi:hypothetical protein
MGQLRRNADMVEDMIRDRERTLLLPVSLAEELPTRETSELVQRMRGELGVGMDRVVVNAVARAPFPPGLEDLDRRLAALPAETELGELPSAPVLAGCAAYLAARYELNRGYVEETARCTGLPVVVLPYLPRGISGPDDLLELAGTLLGEPAPAADALERIAEAAG